MHARTATQSSLSRAGNRGFWRAEAAEPCHAAGRSLFSSNERSHHAVDLAQRELVQLQVLFEQQHGILRRSWFRCALQILAQEILIFNPFTR